MSEKLTIEVTESEKEFLNDYRSLSKSQQNEIEDKIRTFLENNKEVLKMTLDELRQVAFNVITKHDCDQIDCLCTGSYCPFRLHNPNDCTVRCGLKIY